MKITRWGDSLAVKIPDDVVQALRLKEGDSVDLSLIEIGTLGISHRPAAIIEQVIDPEQRATAIGRLRAMARPLPPGYKFDREEANER